MTSVRSPAVAGTFYPAEPSRLAADVDRMLEPAGEATPSAKALIVPHAGYVYSGPVAASAYRRLAACAEPVSRVVLLGPAHTVPLDGMAVSGADEWESPLGRLPIDDELRTRVSALPTVTVDDAPHAQEHALEVQIPFLQRALPRGFSLLPVVVGRVDAEAVADLLDAVWGGPETAVIVSTDLSHYHDHPTAAQLDRATAARIVAGDGDSIAPTDACGAYPVRGLLAAAPRHQLDIELLDLRTSADTAGDPSRVVGYGAFALAAP